MSVLLHLLVGSDNPAKTHRSLCQPDPVALVAIRGLGASHSPEKFLLLVASRKAWGGARRSHPNTSAGAWWHRRRGWWLRWRCTTRRVRQRARPGSQAMRSAGAACPTTLGTTSICSLGCSWISRQPALPRRHKARPARAANTASKGASRALGGRWAARLRGHAAASNATATSDATAAPCLCMCLRSAAPRNGESRKAAACSAPSNGRCVSPAAATASTTAQTRLAFSAGWSAMGPASAVHNASRT
mmetsp:Transcript_114322/g.369650  ORF Transcript_114322/g.369650 Transcript_114322/m.369650 type:complete len:246 (+) Transcript_114322:283-1020(+)